MVQHFRRQVFPALGIADHHMRSGITLHVQPEILLAGMLEGQGIIIPGAAPHPDIVPLKWIDFVRQTVGLRFLGLIAEQVFGFQDLFDLFQGFRRVALAQCFQQRLQFPQLALQIRPALLILPGVVIVPAGFLEVDLGILYRIFLRFDRHPDPGHFRIKIIGQFNLGCGSFQQVGLGNNQLADTLIAFAFFRIVPALLQLGQGVLQRLNLALQHSAVLRLLLPHPAVFEHVKAKAPQGTVDVVESLGFISFQVIQQQRCEPLRHTVTQIDSRRQGVRLLPEHPAGIRQ